MLEKILNKFFKKEEVFFVGSTDILPPPLKKDVEEDLVKRSNTGDLEARNKLIEHKEYISEYGEDLPEIKNWKWE